MKRVSLFRGGQSREREVSCRAAAGLQGRDAQRLDNGRGSDIETHQTDLRNVESKGQANRLHMRRNKEMGMEDKSRFLV